MAKKTLLRIVQRILNDMDSDEVSSINDTIEATQIAEIVGSCYEELISNRNWPHLKTLFQLEASGTLQKPNYLRLPDNVKELISFKYDKIKEGESQSRYMVIEYLSPEDFLTYVNQRDNTKSNIQTVVDFSQVPLQIANDKSPDYWTSFDDKWIVCDSYLSPIENTLVKSKTQALGYIETEFQMDDEFIPNLPAEAFSLLEEEAKSTAFLTLKQMANQKAEMKATRQQRWLSRKAWKAHGGIQYDDYGRKGKK